MSRVVLLLLSLAALLPRASAQTNTTYWFSSCSTALCGADSTARSTCKYAGPAPADGSCSCVSSFTAGQALLNQAGCVRVTPGAAPGAVTVVAFAVGATDCSGPALFNYSSLPADNTCRVTPSASGGASAYVSALVAATANYTYAPCKQMSANWQYGGQVSCASNPTQLFWVVDNDDSCGSLKCTGTGCTLAQSCYGTPFTFVAGVYTPGTGGGSDHGANAMCLTCAVPCPTCPAFKPTSTPAAADDGRRPGAVQQAIGAVVFFLIILLIVFFVTICVCRGCFGRPVCPSVCPCCCREVLERHKLARQQQEQLQEQQSFPGGGPVRAPAGGLRLGQFSGQPNPRAALDAQLNFGAPAPPGFGGFSPHGAPPPGGVPVAQQVYGAPATAPAAYPLPAAYKAAA